MTDSRFPEVRKMSDIFEKGLIVLAALIPRNSLGWLRYPAEFSFEDDALNQKIMWQALKKKSHWIHTNYPIILKGYSGDTMINRNNRFGDTEKTEVIGIGHKVTGVRATIVSHLRNMRDWYLQNNL